MNTGAEPRRIPLPTYPFERQRLVIERPTLANKSEAAPSRVAKAVDAARTAIDRVVGASDAVAVAAPEMLREMAGESELIRRRDDLDGRHQEQDAGQHGRVQAQSHHEPPFDHVLRSWSR